MEKRRVGSLNAMVMSREEALLAVGQVFGSNVGVPLEMTVKYVGPETRTEDGKAYAVFRVTKTVGEHDGDGVFEAGVVTREQYVAIHFDELLAARP